VFDRPFLILIVSEPFMIVSEIGEHNQLDWRIYEKASGLCYGYLLS
jgi:hypothetical protein